MGLWMQEPVAASQESWVQASPSSQLMGAWEQEPVAASQES